jgi:hypothetical protein
MIKPIVLVQIDGKSRLTLLQTDGVHVGFVDRRVDPVLVLWPEQNQIEAILASLDGLPVISPGDDDPVRSAAAAIRRVRSGLTIIANVPSILTKLGEPV